MNSFIGEIRAFPYNFVPEGWAECDGGLMAVTGFGSLFAVIGYQYGGSGALFQLPDLRGKALLNSGYSQGGQINYRFGTSYGSETVQMVPNNLPRHSHDFIGAGGALGTRTSAPDANNQSYLTNVAYQPTGSPVYASALGYLDPQVSPTFLAPSVIQPSCGQNDGSAWPHENRSPYQVVRYCICVTDGDFPVKP